MTTTNKIPTTILMPTADRMPEALNTEQASRYCGLAPATMEGLRCRGGGPRYIKFSRKAVRYLAQDLDSWMSAKAVFNTSESS